MFDSSILQREILPSLAPGQPLDENWARTFINKLRSNQDNLIEATRTSLTELVEDYQTADSFLSASFTEEIGVLTDAVSAQATRITTLESQVQTPTTGLLARVTVTENTLVTQGSAISSLTTTVSSHTSSISTINGQITTLSASVTTNATAITTLDGRMSAYYGIKVAAGTNIATIEAMASGGGVPSTVVISAGQIQLNGNVVVTGSLTYTAMAVNTITQGVIHESDTGTVITTSWTSLGSVSITVPDSNTLVKIDWAFFVDVAGMPLEALEVKLVRNSTDIYYTIAMTQPPEISFYTDADGQFDIPLPIQNNCCGFDTDQPGSGTHTYYLYARGSDGNWTLSYKRLFAMKFVR